MSQYSVVIPIIVLPYVFTLFNIFHNFELPPGNFSADFFVFKNLFQMLMKAFACSVHRVHERSQVHTQATFLVYLQI